MLWNILIKTMETYCVSCKKYTQNKNSSLRRTQQNRLMLVANCGIILLTGDKFMLELLLRQPGFTYSACEPFTEHHERIQKFKETGDLNYIYKNELDKARFAHGSTYADSNNLA